MEQEPKKKGKRGFASMDPETRKRIASLGGRAAHARGKAHQWDSEAAREAGRKGGRISRKGEAEAEAVEVQ